MLRRWSSALFFFALAASVAVLCARVFGQTEAKDFLSFHMAARAVADGADPYDVEKLRALGGSDEVFPYLYSPFLAVIARPLAHVETLTAFRWWTAGAVLAFAAAATFALERGAAHRRRAAPALVVALVLALTLDVRNVLQMGQVNTFVLVPIAASFALRERRPYAAGVALALAGMLKSSPFALVIVFAAERRWRVLASAAAASVVIALLTLPFVGVGAWRAFFALVGRFSRLEEIPGLFPYGEYSNFSFVGLLTRVSGGNLLVTRIGAGVLSLAAIVPVALTAWRHPNRDGVVLAALVVMVLSSPLAYVHHVVYVFPAAAALLLDAATRDRFARAAALVLATTVAGVDFGALGMAAGHGGFGAINAAALATLYVLGLTDRR